ncbi:hypothetical protein JYU14_03855, partial [Simkania negevensis]|nr:hypothetical protein [Simkania negevensis]
CYMSDLRPEEVSDLRSGSKTAKLEKAFGPNSSVDSQRATSKSETTKTNSASAVSVVPLVPILSTDSLVIHKNNS